MSSLVFIAPLDGWCTPLDELPDPVFAARMLGDGVAIDPTGSVVHAPCDGEVVGLPASRHAVTLRTGDGSEILVHVGIDTVGLQGEGFEALVRAGQSVRAGDPMLRFDLDRLAQRAKSLLTPIVVLGEGRVVTALARDCHVRVGQELLRVTAAGEAVPSPSHAGAAMHAAAVVRRVTVGLAHGLHARPAARIVQAAREHAAGIRLSLGSNVADALSITSLMMLGARHGDEVTVEARDSSGARAVEQVAAILAAEDHTSAVAGAPSRKGPSPAADPAVVEPLSGIVRGVVASRGFALGPVHRLRAASFDVPVRGANPAHESAELQRALQVVRDALRRAAQGSNAVQRDIATAHALLLDDPALAAGAARCIEDGHSAGHAWRVTIDRQAQAFERLEDAYLRERAADLRDLEAQVLMALGFGPSADGASTLPQHAIVLAHELLPSQFAALDRTRLGGICTSGGGPTSHVAILASSTGVPMIVAAGPAIDAVPDGRQVLLDAEAGQLHPEPDAALIAEAERHIARDRVRREQERAAAQREGRTADGRRIHVHANLGSPADAIDAVALGAEGCGLLRSEFLFLDRATAPTEDEQFAVYQEIASRLEGRPVTIRTLDVGGDKPLAYLPMPAEDNPALGLRGIRTSLFRPDLLREQLRAILRVMPVGQCRVLLPMVTDVGEVDAVRRELEAALADLHRAEAPRLGVMIETPAAAVLADTLAGHVDFFSIGTNDLTQYALAMDRTHAQLASRLDGLHPAVLRLIGSVCEASRPHDREVAVCGSLALDVEAIPILIGLGVQELSVPPAAVPAVKARIASLDFATCRALALRALAASTAQEVRTMGSPQ